MKFINWGFAYCLEWLTITKKTTNKKFIKLYFCMQLFKRFSCDYIYTTTKIEQNFICYRLWLRLLWLFGLSWGIHWTILWRLLPKLWRGLLLWFSPKWRCPSYLGWEWSTEIHIQIEFGGFWLKLNFLFTTCEVIFLNHTFSKQNTLQISNSMKNLKLRRYDSAICHTLWAIAISKTKKSITLHLLFHF